MLGNERIGIDSTASLKWFALYTRSHHEKSVAQRLNEKGIESFLPLYQSERNWSNNRKPRLALPLFPNYVFVHVAPRKRFEALSSKGAVTFVGPGDTATPIEDAEIQRFQKFCGLADFEPCSQIAIGDRARITSGPLTGLEGVVTYERGKARVMISIQTIARSVCVDVPAECIETIPA
jgi:transcription antitermination factor NusG